ncbi:PAS domain S-box protein [Sesbania bispinosa]|nr:PAS domain S-box protein [Sesbania bispinosa]
MKVTSPGGDKGELLGDHQAQQTDWVAYEDFWNSIEDPKQRVERETEDKGRMIHRGRKGEKGIERGLRLKS